MAKPRKQTTAIAERWLVVAAFAPELAYLRAALPHLSVRVRRRVTLAPVGIGPIEAAIGASRLIVQTKPHAVVLVGTAGLLPACSRRFAVGQAVVARSAVLLADILPGKNAYLPASVPRRAKADPALARSVRERTGLPFADVACPLAITRSSRAAKTVAAISGCALENLEVFAVARAASRAKIPFAAVLGIANRVGPSGHREWLRHAPEAAARACDAVLELLGVSHIIRKIRLPSPGDFADPRSSSRVVRLQTPGFRLKCWGTSPEPPRCAPR